MIPDFQHLARLARLDPDRSIPDLSIEELERLLEFLAILDTFPAGADSCSAGETPACPLREDVPQPSLPRDIALQGAAASDGNFFVVPGVLPLKTSANTRASGPAHGSAIPDQ
jgi:Asp-tRNA(Asn)/Glu-tRNA(Gln) amidotransferase C subunit